MHVPASWPPQGVSGDGNYTSGPTTPDFIGTFYWVAMYSGDNNNLVVSTGCDAEPVTVTKHVTTLTTSAQPQIALVGLPVGDVGTLACGFNPTGAICSGCTADLTVKG